MFVTGPENECLLHEDKYFRKVNKSSMYERCKISPYSTFNYRKLKSWSGSYYQANNGAESIATSAVRLVGQGLQRRQYTSACPPCLVDSFTLWIWPFYFILVKAVKIAIPNTCFFSNNIFPPFSWGRGWGRGISISIVQVQSFFIMESAFFFFFFISYYAHHQAYLLYKNE